MGGAVSLNKHISGEQRQFTKDLALGSLLNPVAMDHGPECVESAPTQIECRARVAACRSRAIPLIRHAAFLRFKSRRRDARKITRTIRTLAGRPTRIARRSMRWRR